MNGFPGFSPAATGFLRDLKANNSREWFTTHKKTYDSELKIPAKHFCDAMTADLQDLTGLIHSAKVFRINRDLRFSKDKTPYNTHLHIAFTPEGPPGRPMWFFGLDPDALALGCGTFAFSKPALENFRRSLLSDDRIGHTLDDLRSQGLRLSDPHLKRIPAGYPADHPRADLLRYKGLHLWTDYKDPVSASGAGLMALCRQDFTRLKPLFDLLMQF